MYNKISEFLSYWSFESGATLQIFKALTDESLNQKVTPDGRSLGQIAWHITVSMYEMLSKAGLELGDNIEDTPAPKKIVEIISEYEKYAGKVDELVREKWNDESLNDEVNMYGQQWKKGKVLSVLVFHQVHHRAQMTVLMRQAGLKVPGIYGPSKEEWTLMGMPPQD